MNTRKRVLSFILSLVMLLSLLPTAAFAAETEQQEPALTPTFTQSPVDGVLADDGEGTVQNTDTVPYSGQSHAPDDLVQVIVVLEDESMLSAAGASVQSFAASSRGQTMARSMVRRHNALRSQIAGLSAKSRSARSTGADFDYTAVLNGFSTTMRYGDIPAAMKLSGVKRIFVANTYALPEEQQGDVSLYMDSSSGMIDTGYAHDRGYTGQGMVVAVVDSGLDVGHEAFAKAPESPRYDKDAIAAIAAGTKLSCGETNADGVYYSQKIPFVFDYVDKDTVVTGGESHGTHVSGTIAADCDKLQGIAPDAQLMMMKVFSDDGASSSDAYILAALDDAVKLDVDSINMSLGATSGFSVYWDETYSDIYSAVENAGIQLLVAAGNETSSALNNVFGNDLPLASEPDSAMVAMPSTYAASVSVASVENVEYSTSFLTDAAGNRYAYSEAVDYSSGESYNAVQAGLNGTFSYVPVPGQGQAADYEGLDVTGKVALVQRGGINFTDKLTYAKAAGAAGIIIYDNVNRSNGSMAVTAYPIPAVFVTKASGEALAAAEDKTVTLSADNYGKCPNPDANTISSFSNWGPGNELTIKPEISAPGGQIYSAVNGGYAVYSGTSMATPHVAGAAALVQAYLRQQKGLSGKDLGDVANDLMMSTARVMTDIEADTGLPYSPRRQGAGMVDLEAALSAPGYLTVSGGRPKAEVGSSQDGRYSYTVTVHNWSDEPHTYALSTDVLTEDTIEQNGVIFAAQHEQSLNGCASVTYSTGDTVTVPAGKSADVTVTIQLTDADSIRAQGFTNGFYVEGFTRLTPVDGDSSSVVLNLPFLGFCGDWENLPMIENYQDLYNVAPTRLALASGTGRTVNLGYNNYSGAYNPDKFALSTSLFGSDRMLTGLVSLLRNCWHLGAEVRDAKGGIVWSWDGGDECFRKAFYYAAAGGIITTTIPSGWNGLIDGEPAANNSEYTYIVKATAPGENAQEQTLSIPFVMDTEKPVVKDPVLYTEDGRTYLSVTVSDNQYIQYVLLLESNLDGYYRSEKTYWDGVDQPGQETQLVFDITGLAADLSRDGYNPGRVCINVGDFANNETYVFVDIGPQNMTMDDAQVEVGGTCQLTPEIYPQSMADIPLTWSSSDESVCTVDENGLVTGVKEGRATVTAATLTGYTAEAIITVGDPAAAGWGRSFGECDELGQEFDVDLLTYKVTGPGTVSLLGKTNNDKAAREYKDIVVPETVTYQDKEWNVTAIGAEAFDWLSDNRKYTDVSSIVLPDTIVTIGSKAFWDCEDLESISIPDSVLWIGEDVFYNVSQAEGLRVPTNIRYIGEGAYQDSALTEAFLPDSLIEIGSEAFFGSSVAYASIPADVQHIGDGLFMECTKLTYVELPDDMTEIPENMFYHTSSLRNIQIPASVAVIGEGAFARCGLTRLVLPEGLTAIQRFAFNVTTDLKEVNIPDSVKVIGTQAFANGEAIQKVTIGSGVERIENLAFTGLPSGVVPEVRSQEAGIALRRSGYTGKIILNGKNFNAYSGTQFAVGEFTYQVISDDEVAVIYYVSSYAHEDVVIPSTVTNEGDGKTYTVTAIYDRVFYNRYDLKHIQLPDTITYVGDNAFGGITEATYINIPASLEEARDFAFANAGSYPNAKPWEIDTLTLSGNMRYWGTSCFTGYKAAKLVLGEGITEIGYSSLAGMQSLTDATLPSTLQRIDRQGMRYCYALENLTLPQGLTYIGASGFAGTGLKNVELSDSLWFIGDNAFNGTIWDDSAYDEEYDEYGDYVYHGPETVRLNGGLTYIGWKSINPAAHVTAVLNSQRNQLVERCDVSAENMPSVVWDGKTDIGYNDGSCVPQGVTVTVSGQVRVDGKLCIEGTLYVPQDADLVIGDDAVIEHPENIVYEGCHHENTDETVTPATCIESGHRTVVCKDCGVTLVDQDIPALGHDFGEWTVTKAPTCTAEGSQTRTCARCGAAETRVVPPTGHVDADNNGKCDVCGADLDTKPTDPDEPGKPDQPSQPDQPANPGVKTGDQGHVILWITAMTVCGLGVCLVLRRRKIN